MEEALEEFFAQLPAHVRDRLDFSSDSLDVLEAWLLDHYPSPEALSSMTESRVLDGAARYIGETYRKYWRSRWVIDPEGKIEAGMPYLQHGRVLHFSLVPLSLATASVDRRWGNFISGPLRKVLAWQKGEGQPLGIIVPERHRRKGLKSAEEDEFGHWLWLMDRALGEFFAEVPAVVRDRLDFSPDSLDVLEAWLLARYPDLEASKADIEVLTMDGAARYIGETIRKNLGGEWWFDEHGWTHNGLPQIKGPGDAPPICPLVLAREAIEARGGSHLHAALRDRRAVLQPKN